MKKIYIYFISIMIVTIAIFFGLNYTYKQKQTQIDKYNLEYVRYSKKEIYGTELATIINKAIDNNIKNDVNIEVLQKDNKQIYAYIPNETNSINIDVKIVDNNIIYKMEALYQGDLEKFILNYNNVLFKCKNIEYHKNGKVKYMFFEQII